MQQIELLLEANERTNVSIRAEWALREGALTDHRASKQTANWHMLALQQWNAIGKTAEILYVGLVLYSQTNSQIGK